MTGYQTHQLGNYQLVRHIGRGAFSDVYLGIHIHLKTPAAIKLLHTELTSSEVMNFRNEARTIARLEHPHIVRVLDFGIDNHTPYIVMVYAPNGTLRQRHPKGSMLSLATVASYVTQIASALQFAHNQNFIHRDIKPENMLLGRNYEVLLSDFGYVQIAQSSNSISTKEMAGTIPYMAPEQFHGKPRYASDQYSLAIAVYEWLTGERPFQGSALEIATQHMIHTPVPIHAKNPAVPLEVEQVLFTALAKEPQQRFATVQAFSNAFQQACNLANPIASASTITFNEISDLPSIGTRPISIGMAPQVLSPDASSTLQLDTFVESYADKNSSDHQELTNESTSFTSHSQHRLSRRTMLFGIAGVAAGSIISNGIWMAKSAGLLGRIAYTPSPVTAFYTYTGHTGPVLTTAWSPDGFRIASASFDTTVKVWGAFAGRPSFTFPLHKDYVWSVAWSPDGKFIASASFDHTVKIWNTSNGNLIHSFPHNNYVKSVAWSPDSKFIASATGDVGTGGSGEHLIYVWDITTKKLVHTYSGHSDGVATVAWSPQGKHIASAGGNIKTGSGDTTVQIWDALSGEKIITYSGHRNMVNCVAWSPTGLYIASASWDRTAQVWKAG